mgnify:CR=1 FL=1
MINPTVRISRRRALFIGATLIGGALAPAALAASQQIAKWRGQALGAHAEIQLAGMTMPAARPVFRDVEAEIVRLEAIFSLYRQESALAQLNALGHLDNPPPELIALLSDAAIIHRQTDGLFDPTVQPLFAFYAAHFDAARRGGGQPNPEAVQAVLQRVGFDKVRFDTGRVEFEQPGMALTLNGIAQGYITDRIAALLRARGFSNLLLDIGEIAAVGRGLEGQGWRIGVQKSVGSSDIVRTFVVSDKCVATSMMLGTTFDTGRTAGHIIHPRLGLVSRYNKRATVIDSSAARADALSTAAILMDKRALETLAGSGIEIYM